MIKTFVKVYLDISNGHVTQSINQIVGSVCFDDIERIETSIFDYISSLDDDNFNDEPLGEFEGFADVTASIEKVHFEGEVEIIVTVIDHYVSNYL